MKLFLAMVEERGDGERIDLRREREGIDLHPALTCKTITLFVANDAFIFAVVVVVVA